MMINIQNTPAEDMLGQMLPTRRVESFHYTDLRSLISTFPAAISKAEAKGDNYKRLVDASRLPVFDGKLFADLIDELPKGVSLEKDVARAQSADIDDTLIAINGLGESDAFALVIEGDATASKPLGLAHVTNSEGMTNAFHKVTVKSQANASVIDRYLSQEGVAHLSSAVVDLVIEKDAQATWIIIQEENADATRLARLNVSLEENSDLKIFMLNAGGKLVRQEINVVSRGEGSNLDIKGVNLIGNGTHVDVTTILSHTVPNTNSSQLYRNIMTGNGKGVFQGQIKVHQIAQKTDAQMACNTLVLSDDAAFYAKPELEIFADDVICAHGATVTELDQDHLFYLRARGVTERTARALLVEAFVDEVVEELEDEALIEALEDIIAAWLDRNG